MKVPTSAEVYAVIRARHLKELKVYSSYSAPDGDMHGNPQECVMMTEWCINGRPIIGIRDTWDRFDKTYPQESRKSKYWLIFEDKEQD